MRFSLALGQLEARILKVDERLAERGALLHVLGRDGDGSLCGCDGGHADRQALIAHLVHDLEGPLAFGRTEQVRGRHPHVLKEQLASVLRVHADLLERTAHAVTGKISCFNHDE